MSSTATQNDPDLALPIDVVVRRKRRIASRVVAIDLEPSSARFPDWTPGAHIDVRTPVGWRSYSLCGSVDEPVWRIAVLREESGRGGSAWVHDHLEAGMTLSVRTARNLFPVIESKRYLFIAGGIGITPLLPMLTEVDAAGAQWSLTYGASCRGAMAFLDELAEYGGRVRLWPLDSHGLLPLDSLLPPHTDDPTAVYCCGPEGLISAVEQRCQDLPRVDLRIERFTARTSDDTENGAFDVVLARSGRRLTVGPDDTILDVVEDAGIMTAWSCRVGVCGTCETRVLSGTPQHRDEVLYPEEREANDRMMTCVSRAETDELTLDL
ncbi:PDR/VanB family oxidoreductase [Pseudonocardia spinosispora]|uniref:PDR/VanB family oxidoreductase n=1 Tax=Pseudonocardia spinosispora TaxID=103441 RepID=UPI0004237142|nr:PDR/VanB family oxidoreductase [Pseudonocardia spinosispora]